MTELMRYVIVMHVMCEIESILINLEDVVKYELVHYRHIKFYVLSCTLTTSMHMSHY